MKETFYFSHDYNARSDEKIIKLISKIGWEGYGLYWAIIEKLYEADGFLKKDYECIAFDLRTQCERIKEVVESDLFLFSKDKFYSKSVLARLRARKGKSEKARQSAFLRWNKPKKDNANAMRTQCDSNAIKESKVKESKVKENNIAIKDCEVKIIPNLLNDKQKHIQIIGLYQKAKKIIFENKKQQSTFIKRNLRSANELTGYNFDRIAITMNYLENNVNFKWTLESVGKYISEDLNKLNNNQAIDLTNL